MKSTTLAYRYALGAVLLWSSVATAFKITLQYLNPIELVVMATFFSLLFFTLLLYFQKKLDLVIPYIKNNTKHVILMGLMNPFLYYLVLFKAYDILPAQEAQAINYTWALMLAFLSVPLLKHKLSLSDIIAGLICYFGVLVIATRGAVFDLEFSNLEGVFFALLSTVIWALYWIFNTKSTHNEPVIVLFGNFLIGFPLILGYYFFTHEITIPSMQGILGSLYIGLFEMGLAFVFWIKAMQYTPKASQIANLIFISPFLSLIFIYYILGEEIFISTIFGLFLIIFGLIVQQYKLFNYTKL